MTESFFFLIARWCPSLRDIILKRNAVIDDSFAARLNSGLAIKPDGPEDMWDRLPTENDPIWGGRAGYREFACEKERGMPILTVFP